MKSQLKSLENEKKEYDFTTIRHIFFVEKNKETIGHPQRHMCQTSQYNYIMKCIKVDLSRNCKAIERWYELINNKTGEKTILK